MISRHDKFKRPDLTFHIKIATSLSGIGSVLQSTPEQIVCVDNEKTLKFYNFIDKVAQLDEERFQSKLATFLTSITPFFDKLDKDKSGFLDMSELSSLI
jgi:D-mannonate dehydratase